MKTLCLLLTVLVTLANAQTTPPPASACSVDTKKMTRDAKSIVKLQCELEKAQLRREIREAKKSETKPTVPGPIGVASKSVAVTTVTYRDNTGKALEGSSGWAKHTETLAKLEASIAKAEAKASQPQGCGWLGCYTPVVYGYGGGYGYGYTGGYYYGGGAYGTNRVYGTGGGGHGRRH